MSIKTVILSLPNDVERRRFCESEIARFGLCHKFSDAIAGDQISNAELRKFYDADMNRIKFKRPLSRNEVACTLGHRQIWQEIVKSQDYVSLVLEDDAAFVQDPRSFLEELLECGKCFEDVMIKLDGISRNNGQVIKSVADQNLILSDRLPPRTTGYIIGRRAAKRLLALNAPIARPIDIDLKFYWEHNVPILTLGQKMITEREDFNSTIDHCRSKTKPGSSMARFVRNLMYQTKYTYGRLSHPLNPDMIEGLGPLMQAGNRVRNRA
ncbi:glycosyltransferase family 25 protein [Ruegeria atlantica]|uniref:Glycosyltransferase family 25 (LPS biosynthesis protein) n=1 Tax=Ruegeria atlantica TaxID=81569 RepID=A0A0P1F2C3_9RHOB|nr:glycosyltransferase family 25 protein [Ruegeria atlantica]CUH49822.1 Glycosyltransferase family 25 (LPS biosynthesis protein) [Ruegeria atlantica]